MSHRKHVAKGETLVEKMLRFAFFITDSYYLPKPETVCERFEVSRATAYRWLATARAIRGGFAR